MSLLSKKKPELKSDPKDFRYFVEFQGQMYPICRAGINGRQNCCYYIPCHQEYIPGIYNCAWFGEEEHDCLRPN